MKKFEMILIPSHYGLIKVYIYGFSKKGGKGKVLASFNDLVVSARGSSRKRTIINALIKLHESLINHE